jgi:hypothetical protein
VWPAGQARTGAQVVIVPDATHSLQTRATDNTARVAVYHFLTQ